jgi:hypothetical protein
MCSILWHVALLAWGIVAPVLTSKREYHPMSAVSDCFVYLQLPCFFWMPYLCQPEDVLIIIIIINSIFRKFVIIWSMNLPVFFPFFLVIVMSVNDFILMILMTSGLKLITVSYTNSVPTSQRTHRVITSTRAYMKTKPPSGQICTFNIIYSMHCDFN